jgi:monomeric sarcosine oxidase
MAVQELPDQTDVVVVGGGIMGASTTYFLATETDQDVVLVERDNIASGSTGDSSAILRHHYGAKGVYPQMAQWSHEFYREFEQRVGERVAYGSAPMVRFADETNGSDVTVGREILEELDIPVSRYEGEELSEQYPMIETDRFEFAVSDDDAGYSDATDAAGGFVRAAQRHGGTVITGVAVEDLQTEDGRVTGVETEDGPIACDRVVVTAGPWTAQFMEQFGVEIPMTPSREQVLLLDPPEQFREKHLDDLPTSGPAGGWYIRPDFGGGVLVATHHTGEQVDPDNYSEAPDEEMILHILEELEEFAPDLVEADIKGQYCGVYSTTPDHDFIIDQAGPDGCYVGCGFSGHGFKHGPIVGRILSDLATTGDTDVVDLSHFSLDRFDEHPDGNTRPIQS